MPASGRLIDFTSRHGGLAAAVALAAALQIFIAARSPVIALDGITFIELAQALEDNPRQTLITFDQHPGYPALLLATARVGRFLSGEAETPSLVWAGRIASGVCGAACVVLVWLLTRHLFDRRIADVAAVVFAVVPLVRQNATDVLSDTPHLAFYLLAAWCIAVGLSSARVGWFAAGGAASGLAYWIRPEGLSVALIAVAVTFCWFVRPAGARRFRVVLCLTATVAAAAVVVGPYMLLAGKFTSKKDAAMVQRRRPAHEVPFVNDEPADSAAPEVAATPPTVSAPPVAAPRANLVSRLCVALAKYVEEVGYGFRYLLLVPLACGHWAIGQIRPRASAYAWVWALALFHTALLLWLHYSAGYIGHRHVIPLVALGMPFVATGACYLGQWAARRWNRRACWTAGIAGAAVAAVVCLPAAVRPLNYASRPVVQAAVWVDHHRGTSSRVLANSLYVGFYARMPGEVLGVQWPDLQTAMSAAAQYDFVVMEIDARRFRPPDEQLRTLGYATVQRFSGGPDRPWHQVRIYRRHTKTARAAAEKTPQQDASGAARF